MTREEAKSILFDMLGDTTIIKPTEQNQAILTAIKALEQEPCDKYILDQSKEREHKRLEGLWDGDKQKGERMNDIRNGKNIGQTNSKLL